MKQTAQPPFTEAPFTPNSTPLTQESPLLASEKAYKLGACWGEAFFCTLSGVSNFFPIFSQQKAESPEAIVKLLVE